MVSLGFHATAAATAASLEFVGVYLLTIPAIAMILTWLLLAAAPLLRWLAARGALTILAFAAPTAVLAAAFTLMAEISVVRPEWLVPIIQSLFAAQLIFAARNFVPATLPAVDQE